MRAAQAEQVAHMRWMGKSYKSIADTMGIPLNTVKSFCRRNKLAGWKSTAQPSGVVFCAYCGAGVPQTEHRKRKKYCSDACRMKWWNAHRHLTGQNAKKALRCPSCGREFTDYASAGRKYCSHACYIKARFGGKDDE